MPKMQFTYQPKQEVDIFLQDVPGMRYGYDFTVQQLTRFFNPGKHPGKLKKK